MSDASADAGRALFRYLVGEEWAEYRAIMATFAGTFFAEFTPEDVGVRLAAAGVELELTTVGARLERLREWGNLTISTAIGSPSSLADYYRRRNRYLITRAGQDVHDVVEGVLGRVDEIRDVSPGRLRAVRDAVEALAALDVARVDPVTLADVVRAVFDPHAAFTTEIAQFFAAINQWQTRYDLDDEEFRFFADVLVGYVGDRLEEIERSARPIGRLLVALDDRIPTVVARMHRGLAGQVERAGLDASVVVSQQPGARLEDWDHLRAWFVATAGRPSRIERLTRDAVAAIRTLTLNLTRLSRRGVEAASRRADFLRLAAMIDGCDDPDDAHAVLNAAFGLFPPNHYGVLAADADDPVATSTPWWDAPQALVPVSLRERGDTTNRGRPSPIADRRQEQALLRLRREQEQAARRAVDDELLAAGELDGATLSEPALARLQQLVGRTAHRAGGTVAAPVGGPAPERPGGPAAERPGGTAAERAATDGALTCVVRRVPGRATVVHAPGGTLTFLDVEVRVRAAVPGATDGPA